MNHLPNLPYLLALGGLCLATACNAPTGSQRDDTQALGSVLFVLGEQSQSCKPDAPVRLELFPSDLYSSGVVQLSYNFEPTVDALDAWVEFEFPDGGFERNHSRPVTGPLPAFLSRQGSARLQLPTGLPGVRFLAHAHILLPDPEGIDGQSLFTTTRAVVYGDPQLPLEGVTPVEVEGELFLDTNAKRSK